MNILLIGGGGREHALAWKIAQSDLVTTLYCAPGNPGMAAHGTCVDIADKDVPAIVDFARGNDIALVVVGPEAPLAAGLADRLAEAGIPCFGPSRAAAQIETSKVWLKGLCQEFDIPTARFGSFAEAGPAKAFLGEMSPPYVIKASGLAAGKGVIIAETLPEAEAAIDDMLSGQFGPAGTQIVIEEYLDGEEASFFVISDGTRALPLIAAQDHKRAYDGDTGPNTGGMGAYSPAPVFTDTIREQTMERIIEPTIKAMRTRGCPYVGVLYAGLMITADGPKLIEYNARFGDPECQVLMRRMTSDIVPALMAAAKGNVGGQDVSWSNDAAALVVYAARGYPGPYEKGSEIRGIGGAEAVPDAVVFQAGTKTDGPHLLANGGRVLNITATGKNGREAIARAYEATARIDWPEGFYRTDIGWRLLAREDEATDATS